MYEPSIRYSRTPEERANQMLAWDRPDKAFFASGACHILAYTFVSLHPGRDLKLIFIRPQKGQVGTHMYVLDGDWAFDFNGWVKESELLDVTKAACTKKYYNWDYDRVELDVDLETFCRENYHRPPAYYAHLPWERTYKFIEQFDAEPPRV